MSFELVSGLINYSVLKKRVGEVFVEGRRRVEKELVRMRYHTGLLINEHVRLNHGRAEYGSKALLRLEKDFGVDDSELARYSQFARSFPILGGRRELKFNLPWQHYRKLMVITDDDERIRVTLEAEKNDWPFEKVETRVRYLVGKGQDEDAPPRLSKVLLGPLFTYKIIRVTSLTAPTGELLLDLGFKHRLEMDVFLPAKFPEGTIVTSTKDAKGRYSLEKTRPLNPSRPGLGQGDDLLYTYKAFVEAVVDGDTLKLDFLPGFGNRKGETIRLNHIDCPELDTPEGKAAKNFVERELAGCGFLTVKSVRTRKEKWGRYLVDVFYARRGRGPLVYLNQLLLDKGHAVRVRS